MEVFLRVEHDPDDIDFIYEWCFVDRAIERYFYYIGSKEQEYIPITRNGFRGKRENLEQKDGLGIIVVGAGHSFANNIPFGHAWPELLEKTLQDNDRAAEIVNWSVNGSTVVFAQKVLLPKMIENNPSHIIFSHSGYNEAITTYISDQQVIYPDHTFFNVLMSFETIRFGYKAWNKQKKRWMGEGKHPKVSPSEFRKIYQDILLQVQAQGIRVILLQQEVITPDIKDFWKQEDLVLYRNIFAELSQEFQIPLIDPKDIMTESPNSYFENQEYYNKKMHKKIADVLGSFFLFPKK